MRKKSWKQVAAIVICAALLSGCTGENGQEKNTGRKEGQVVNIYCWNDEFKEIYDKYASDLAKKHDVEVNFVIISSDNNAYQINLDEALKEQNTCIDDDKVDLFFDIMKKRLIETISKEQANGEMYIDLIMIAKYYERIGDHATNIAEWVLYYLTGTKVSGNKDS